MVLIQSDDVVWMNHADEFQPFVKLSTAALFTEKSPFKNVNILKVYRERTACARKDRTMLSFMTKRLVTPEDEN
jgi:hypothetical protein